MPAASSCTVLTNVSMLVSQPTPHWQPGSTLAWVGDTIVHAGQTPPTHLLTSRDDVTIIDGQGQCVTPGLMDVHINGAFGCDFAHASPNQLYHALGQLPQRGITSVVPTIITAPQEDMMASLQTLEEVMRQPVAGTATVLGFHLEGPFLSPDYAGIHPPDKMPAFRPAPEQDVALLNSLCSPNVRLMTLAPECIDLEIMMPLLAQRRIVALAGHTGASSEVMAKAINAGLAGVTHLYNAMKPLHHRAPGVVAAALTHPQLMTTIIADGVHVYPEAVRVACHACGPERLVLVSDALHLAGTPEGTETQFAGQTIALQNGKATNAEGKLAGSAALLDNCVRNLIAWGLVDSAKAFTMATAAPATLLKESHRYGTLAPNYTADVVLWDEHWQPKLVWAKGKSALLSEALAHC